MFTGERRSKTDPTFEALGSTDELNANVGLARELALRQDLPGVASQLEVIMSRLFDVGAAIATPLETANAMKVFGNWKILSELHSSASMSLLD